MLYPVIFQNDGIDLSLYLVYIKYNILYITMLIIYYCHYWKLGLTTHPVEE